MHHGVVLHKGVFNLSLGVWIQRFLGWLLLMFYCITVGSHTHTESWYTMYYAYSGRGGGSETIRQSGYQCWHDK